MKKTKRAKLLFKSGANKNTSISILNPVAELDAEMAKQVMNQLSQAKAFEQDGVHLYETAVAAHVIETTDTTLFKN